MSATTAYPRAEPVNTSTPLVSIIVAVRNAESTLERTLVSALEQTYANKELVVIDGASTDGTMTVANRFRDKLAVLLSEPDKGIADAYNKGIARARGEWLYFLNADDVFASTTVLADIFGRGPYENVSLIVGKVQADTGKMFSGRFGWPLLMKNTVHHQAIFYRSSVLKQLNYNSQYRRYGHDHEHNIRLWQARTPVKYISNVIALWGSEGISNNAKWADYREEFRIRRNTVGATGWLWNVFTVIRFVLKKLRIAIKS